MIVSRRILLSAAALAVPALAHVQSSPPARIRGTITFVAGPMLTIATRTGDTVTVAVRNDTVVTAIASAGLADIKPGSYIGTAALPQPDGSLLAREIQVFPESMRGVGEGHRPYDLEPQSTMTNGTVGDVVGTEGRVLTLRYKDGEKKVTVPAGAPIITYEPGSPAMLVAGAHVIVTASPGSDGALSASRIGVGKDGLTPPM